MLIVTLSFNLNCFPDLYLFAVYKLLSKKNFCPGQVAQLVRASPQYTKVVCGFNLRSGHVQEPINEYIKK